MSALDELLAELERERYGGCDPAALAREAWPVRRSPGPRRVQRFASPVTAPPAPVLDLAGPARLRELMAALEGLGDLERRLA